jgi:hypothetical protein
MNLFAKSKKKQAGQIGQTTENALSLLSPEGLAALRQLIEPMRERMARYDEAIKALAIARDQLIDAKEASPPDMSLTVQRELLVARGDAQALNSFDAEFGEALQAERDLREEALRAREELPARIQALETLVKQIATEMRAHLRDILTAQDIAVELFKPFAREAYEAAQAYVKAVQRAHSASYVLASVITVQRYDLFGDYKETMAPELYGVRGNGVLPKGLPGYSHEEIEGLTHALNETDEAFSQQLQDELAATGLRSEDLRTYGPPAADDMRRVYVPENLLKQRFKSMPTPSSHAAAVVTI